MAIDRMGYTDHGPTHVKIVANLSLKLLRILMGQQVKPSIVKNYGMGNDDAEVVVVLGSVFHDLGMVVIRHHHELYSAMMAREFIEAEKMIAEAFHQGEILLDKTAMTINDVGGIKIVADEDSLSKLEERLAHHPFVKVLGQESYQEKEQASDDRENGEGEDGALLGLLG